MGTMTTRINGIRINVHTDANEFVVTAAGGNLFDTMATANMKGNYAKVVCMNEVMRDAITHTTTGYVDCDFPFEDTTEWVAIATANGFVK